MKITKIQVENYRLLKKFSIDIEKELSLVIGKNNCGKTSLLSVIDKFLNDKRFTYEDFNLDFKEDIIGTIEKDVDEKYSPIGIKMKLFIEYADSDNLSNISNLMMDLDPGNNSIILSFEYVLTADKIKKLKEEFEIFSKGESGKAKPKDLSFFLRNNYSSYFQIFKKTIDPKDSTRFIDIEKEKIQLNNVINFKYINANRDVSNKDAENSLSTQSFRIYEKIETDESHNAKINDFKNVLYDTDESLGTVYETIFKETIDKVKKFGGLKPDETLIKITSTLQHKNLLQGNTTVVYKHDANELPESYNGLGYMNLISMIFEIEILLNKFKRKKTEIPADINLLFIEEPEAHTHPQMQYVFIKNIKSLLKEGIIREDGENRELQYIISTHSSHIVAESNFNDIKYLKREKNTVIAKNLSSLEAEYEKDGQKENYKFLKQYLTLHRSELFFADKAIFIEGDTERILLPAMMKKIDQADQVNPLLSQNISIIEVGNYSHIFEKFIDFFGIKSLIITDIDSAMSKNKMNELKDAETDENKKKKIKQKVRVSDPNATITTNESLKYFYDTDGALDSFNNKEIAEMTLEKIAYASDILTRRELKKWVNNSCGYLLCVYQTIKTNIDNLEYHARSFEDSFFRINRQFIIDNKDSFKSLKNIEYFEEKAGSDYVKDAYELAESCIDKKPAFAIEILLNSRTDERNGNEYSDWQIPAYINEGLLWLKD
jgi:predicted ATP-dependent endonuclease of OLD family